MPPRDYRAQAENNTLRMSAWRGLQHISLFNVIDDFNREAFVVKLDFSLPSECVIRSFDQIIAWRAKPTITSRLSISSPGQATTKIHM